MISKTKLSMHFLIYASKIRKTGEQRQQAFNKGFLLEVIKKIMIQNGINPKTTQREIEYLRYYIINFYLAFLIINLKYLMGNSQSKKFVVQSSHVSGCYLRRPQQVGIKLEGALVPLKHIDYQVNIVNCVAQLTLTQTYMNPTNKFLEVDYSIPQSSQAIAYKFEVQFNNIKIEGVVKGKDQANKLYQESKKQGKQVVIGQLNQNSKDILNIQIGNIPPKTQFKVKVYFLQQLKIVMNTFYQLRIPATISPRFLNHVKGQGNNLYIQNMMNSSSSTQRANFTWSFLIDVQSTHRIIFFDSPSHAIALKSSNEKETKKQFILQKNQIPYHNDFVFAFTTENFHLPSYVQGNTDESSTVLISFIPKFCTMNIQDAFKAALEKKSYETDIDIIKGDYIFILDRSGSMSGSRIQKAKQSLILFMKSLPQDSYFNIVSFGDSYFKHFPKSEKNTSERINAAIKQVKEMDADLGGTQIYYPLQDVFKQEVVSGYPRHVFLLTDGGVSNTEGVIALVRNNTKFCRVHAIGIGQGVSYNLIQGCALNGKGHHVFISDNENPSQKIISMLQSTFSPIVNKIKVDCSNSSLIESIIPNPSSIPYILKDEAANFYVTLKGRLKQPINFTFQYQDSTNRVPFKSEITIKQEKTVYHPFINKLAHFKVLKQLQRSAEDGVQIQDHIFYVKQLNYKQEAIRYSIRHQVLSKYTAFICVGKQLIDGQYQQYKDKGTHKVYIEQPKPSYYQDEGISFASRMVPHSILRCQQQQQDQLCYENIYEQKAVMEAENLQCYDIGMSKKLDFSQEAKNLTKNKEELSLIDEVVEMQAADGSWTDIILIKKLGLNIQQITIKSKEIQSSVVVTQLVILWLLKHYPQKQYSLIIKKGSKWLQKKCVQYGISKGTLQIIKPL